MNFGVRLPGPFRVGISSRGRVTGGVTMGPFSASGQLGGGQRTQGAQATRGTLDQAIAAAQAQGCRVMQHGQGEAIVQRGWWAWHIRTVQGGVTITQTWSMQQTLALTAGLFAVFGLCAAVAFL